MSKQLLATVCLLLTMLSVKAQQGVTYQDNWPKPNGPVHTIQSAGGRFYIGGSFTQVGSSGTSYGAPATIATSVVDAGAVQPNAQVQAVVPDGAGGWYIGGDFTMVGGQVRNHLARINSDGSLHTWNPNADGNVTCMTLDGTTMYVGGQFANVGGQARNKVAAISTSTGLATSWTSLTSMSNVPYKLLNASSRIIYVDYSGFRGLNKTTGAMDWDYSGYPIPGGHIKDTKDPGFDGEYIYYVADSTYYTTEYLDDYYIERQYIGRFNINTQTDQPYWSYVGSIITADVGTGPTSTDPPIPSCPILAYGNKIYFNTYNYYYTSASNVGLKAITKSGAATGWNVPITNNALGPYVESGAVKSLYGSGGNVYFTGDFNSVDSATRIGVAAADTSTASLTSFAPVYGSTANCIAVAGAKAYVGGTFTSAGGFGRLNAFAIDSATGGITPWSPALNGAVYALQCVGGRVFMGGEFTNVGSAVRNRVASVDTVNGNASNWNPNANSLVYSLAIAGSQIYMGGQFSQINGVMRSYAAAVDSGTAAVSAWNPAFNNGVVTMTVKNQKIYVGGGFTAVGAVNRKRAAAFVLGSTTPTTWNPAVNSIVQTLVQDSAFVYIGGEFDSVASSARIYAARVDTVNGALNAWNPGIRKRSVYAGGVRSILPTPSAIFIGGGFDSLGSARRRNLASVSRSNTATLNLFDADVDANIVSSGGFIQAMRPFGNGVLAGGAFSDMDGNSTRRFLMPLLDSASLTLITTGTISLTSVCQGTPVLVPFTISGTYTSGNVFTAQLSDASGSFASPINIGTLTGTTDGTIGATIPATQAAGTGYRIRVVSSTPASIGSDNGTNISIYALPAATITPNTAQTICTGGSLVFSVGTTSGASYQWNLNGSPISGATSASYTATTAGSYSVDVISSAGCAATSSPVSLTINNCIPFITDLSPASNLCRGNAVAVSFSVQGSYNSGNVFTVQLSNASGSFVSPVNIGTLAATTSSIINATIPATQAVGTGYRIRVVSSSPATTGSDNGTNLSVIAAPAGAQTAISPATTPIICAGSTATLSVPFAAGYTYQWRLNGVDISGATNNTYAASVAGTYTVIVTNASGCSALSGQRVVNVKPLPIANISPSTAQNICGSGSVTFSVNATSGATYQWRNNGTAISGATATSYTATATGNYSVTVTSNAGCAATSSTVAVTVGSCGPVITALSPSGSFCQGSVVAVSFTAPGSYNSGNVFTVQLSNAAGSFASPVAIGTLTGTTGGTVGVTIPATQAAGTGYRIRVTSSNPATTGADNGTNLSVITTPAGAQTAVSPAATPIICAGTTVTLSVPATAGSTYQWRLNGTNISGATANTYAASVAGTYTVIVTNASGCSALSGQRVVNVKPLPIANISPSTAQNICGSGSVTFSVNATSGATYQWRNNGTAISGATATSYTATATGNYSVTVTSNAGCAATSSTVAVTGCPIAGGGGLGDFAARVALSLYPNPSTAAGTLLIQSSTPGERYEVRVLDIAGRPVQVLVAEAGHEAGFGQSLAPGIYTVEALGAGGQRVVKMWIRQ